MGKTPAFMPLKTKRPHEVRLVIEDEEHLVTLERTVNGWTFGNLLFGWIPGFIIDAITGANFRLVPEAVHVDFEGG